MNWAQILAAAIVSVVTLVNLFFTVKMSKEKEVNEVKRKYTDRQSDALEAWWLLTMKPLDFKNLRDEEQDNLIKNLIWLPKEIKNSAYEIIKNDDQKNRDELRKKINTHLSTII